MTLKFVRDQDGDYHAVSKDIKYTIYKSSDAGFGLSVHPARGEDYPAEWKKLARLYTQIAWLRTKGRCEEWANKVDASLEPLRYRAKHLDSGGGHSWLAQYRVPSQTGAIVWKTVRNSHGEKIQYATEGYALMHAKEAHEVRKS